MIEILDQEVIAAGDDDGKRVPAPDANPTYRRETNPGFPSGDGFILKSEQ